MKKIAPTVSAMLLLAATAGVAHGGVLLGTYTFTNGETSTPTDGVTGVTFSPFSRAAGLVFDQANGGGFGTKGWTTSIDGTKYVEFSVTAAAGYRVSLDSISFNYQGLGNNPTVGQVRYSGDNFTAPPTGGSSFTIGNGSGVNGSWNHALVTMIPGGSTTYRFYAAGGTSSNNVLRLDDVAIFGTVQAVNLSNLTPGTVATVNTLRGTPVTRSLTITNTGTDAGTYSASVAGGSGFSVSSNATGSVAASNGTASVGLTNSAATVGKQITTVSVANTSANATQDPLTRTTSWTVNVFDSSMTSGSLAGAPAANLVGSNGSYALANVNFATPVAGGTVNVNGLPASSLVYVLVDLVDGTMASTLRSNLISAGFNSANITTSSPVLSTYSNVASYDLMFTFSNPGAASRFSFDYSAISGITVANVAIVPESSALMGMIVPAIALVARRRRQA